MSRRRSPDALSTQLLHRVRRTFLLVDKFLAGCSDRPDSLFLGAVLAEVIESARATFAAADTLVPTDSHGRQERQSCLRDLEALGPAMQALAEGVPHESLKHVMDGLIVRLVRADSDRRFARSFGA